MKKTKLNKLIAKLRTGLEPIESFDVIESDIKKLTKRLHQKVEAESLQSVNSKIDEFRRSLDLTPITKSLQKLQSDTEGVYAEMGRGMDTKFSELFDKVKNALEVLGNITNDSELIRDEISSIRGEFKANKGVVDGLSGNYSKVSGEISIISQDLKKFVKELEDKIGLVGQGTGKAETGLLKLQEDMEKFRGDILTIVNNVGGGQANRNISVGGNPSTLSKYGDINLKAGSNVTITYTSNNTTKNTDITIAATGGSGTVRSIARTAVSSVIGAVAGTDYVTIATDGVKLDLPTAIGNTNLYTIKNVAASSVLVAPTGGQTIDGDTSLILATQFTAVDLINDGNDNWSIT